MFEHVKSQGCLTFLRQWYGSTASSEMKSQPPSSSLSSSSSSFVKPHYVIEPTFIHMAGIFAAVTQQIVFHPLSKTQAMHHAVSEHTHHPYALKQCEKELIGQTSRQIQSAKATLKPYFRTYYHTFARCRIIASKSNTKGLLRWPYNGFLMSTIRQIPSTSTGLMVFELLRRSDGIANNNVTATQAIND